MPDYRKFSERELILLLREGDHTAFRIFFDQYFRKLYNFSYQFLKDKALAEEVVQDTLLNVWTNRYKLNDSLPIAPYLFTITRRLTLNALRHIATSQVAMEKQLQSLQRIHNETEEKIFLNDLKRFTESALVKLPKQQQLVFRMNKYEGLNYEEIANLLNLSPNTVKNHLTAALKNLRSQFGEFDIVCLLLLTFPFIK